MKESERVYYATPARYMGNVRRSQGAVEFLVMIGAALFFFAFLMIVVYDNIASTNREKEERIVENLALSIQDEINLAEKSTNGYHREFYVPEKISFKDYYINITGNRIYIETEKNAVSFPVKEVEGAIKKGVNLIQKKNDKVYLN